MKLKYILLLFIHIFFTLLISGCSFIQNKDVTDEKTNTSLEPAKSGIMDLSQEDHKIIQTNEKSDVEFFYNKPLSHPEKILIKIFKEQRFLELYGNDKIIGRFKVALGRSPKGDKHKEGDSKTPEGNYYICTRNNKSKFTLFLGLSYPNIEDAKKGLESGLINTSTFNRIKQSIENKQQPPWNTPLGGEVGIHGGGTSSDWTLGCIAMSDEDIKVLWKYASLKTPVEINP